MKKISNIQYITRDHSDLSHAEQARLMFENGIDWVQLRMKEASDEAILNQAKLAMQYATELNGILIINDKVKIAKEVNAHGVHLGLNDMKPSAARILLGKGAIIGGTANTFSQLEQQVAEGADYLGLGPFRYTKTKKNLSPVIGFSGYKELLKEVNEKSIQIPIVAVGGISLNDIISLKELGLHGVALSKALLEAVEERSFKQMNF